MIETSYDVRIWKIQSRKNKHGKVTSHRVRWEVKGREHHAPFKNKAQADSFRSELVTAASKGEAFLVDETGLPVSMARTSTEMTWFEFACAYVDMKWPNLAGNSRKGVSETLTTVTPALFATDRGMPSPDLWRRALHGWAFNSAHRSDEQKPQDVETALRWISANTLPVTALSEPNKMREVLRLISTRLDGDPAAATVVRRKRAILYNMLDYAVEQKTLPRNPLHEMKSSIPKTVRAIDKRTVVNHQQAMRLLEGVRSQKPSGPRLVALFATMYYSALRPAEATNLRRQDIVLPPQVKNERSGEWEEPDEAWGELLLSGSSPETGARWSRTGVRRDDRSLKHRGRGEVRPVPCPPPLTKLLRRHLAEFPPGADGLVFRGVYTQHVSGSHYTGVWRKARQVALTPDEAESPLARRPYDLRHAAVSTWLNSGVPPTQVAEWAGHSVAVLLQVYAKCIAGQEDLARRRIQEALRLPPDAVAGDWPPAAADNRGEQKTAEEG